MGLEIPADALLKDAQGGGVLSIDLDDLEKKVRVWQVGHGWDSLDDEETVDSVPADLEDENAVDSDVVAVALGARGPIEMVKFNQKDPTARVTSSSGAMVYLGDDRTGRKSKKGDDEKVLLYLDRLEAIGATKVAIVTNIHSPAITYGQVPNAYVRVYPQGKELDMSVTSVIKLTDKGKGARCVVFGWLEQVDDPQKPGEKKWIFTRVEQQAANLVEALEGLGVKITR